MFKRLILLWPACVGAAYLWSALSGPAPSTPEQLAELPDPDAGAELQEVRSFAAMRKASAPLSAEERFVKAELEYELRSGTVSDRIVMTDGRELHGRVLEKSAQAVRLLRSFGDSGEMEVMLRPGEIARIDRVQAEAPSVSDRDVRFRMEFPDFNLYRRPPFTIMTNQRFLDVEDAVGMLEQLNRDLREAVGPLLGEEEREDGIQILFFSDEAKFAEYRDAFAPSLAYASGFYSPIKDRLVIFDQSKSNWVQDASDRIHTRLTASASFRRSAQRHDRYTEERRRLQGFAAMANRVIVRHEGAHQLLHSYGVHSERGVEHLWLIEGLASYFEARSGEENVMRRVELQENRGPFLSFDSLVNYSTRSGLGGIGGEREVSLAYAQSWLLVDYLMRERTAGFFEYIRFIRDPANAAELGRPRFELLTRFVGASLASDLEQELLRVRRAARS